MVIVKKTANYLLSYIIVFFLFGAIDAFIAPIGYEHMQDRAELLMLIFVLFLGTIFVHVRKSKNAKYYVVFVVLLLIYDLLYKMAASRL